MLVHGYDGASSELDVVAARLEEDGRDAIKVDLPERGKVDIRRSAQALARAVRVTGARQVDVVAHSLGGLVARTYVRWYGGARRVRRLVMLGTPNHGTKGAADAPGCGRACAQLTPGSAFLTSLNRGDETPCCVRYISIWTRHDELISPPSSSILAGARNVKLQSTPGILLGHNELLTEEQPIDITVEALAE